MILGKLCKCFKPSTLVCKKEVIILVLRVIIKFKLNAMIYVKSVSNSVKGWYRTALDAAVIIGSQSGAWGKVSETIFCGLRGFSVQLSAAAAGECTAHVAVCVGGPAGILLLQRCA